MQKRWNPQDFIGYSEKHGLVGEPSTTDHLPSAVEDLRQIQQAKLEQEQMLGPVQEEVTPEEVALIKQKMIQKLRGY